MNIFIIPSWYPDSENPLDGIFIKEQTEALAEFHDEVNFIVSVCNNSYLSISRPDMYFKTLNKFRSSEKSKVSIRKNLIELYDSALTWSPKLGGEVNNIVKAHESNFQKAKSEFGKIDLIHAHVSFPGGFAAMELNKKFDIPFVITEHMGPFPFEKFLENGNLSSKISEPLLNADKVIAVSSSLAKEIEFYKIPSPVIIPNLVNEDIFTTSNTEKKTGEHRTKFLTVSSFTDLKGIKELLKGILKAVQHSRNFEITIAGSGPLESYIENFIEENHLGEIITLVINPERKDVVGLFRESDAFILPSRHESFGIVYLEAMSCGIPVIATDCGGPSDFIRSFNGILIPVNDADKISEALIYISDNILNYSKDVIRKFAVDNYSRKAVTDKIIYLYKEVLKIY